MLFLKQVALPVPGGVLASQHDEQSSNSEEYHVDSGIASGSQSVVSTIDRRKDKWRTASSRFSKDKKYEKLN